MKKVLIIGFYGWGNAGDESILSGILNILTTKLPPDRIEVATDIPYLYHRGYSWIKNCSIRTLSNFNMSDIGLVIYGGGGLCLGYGYGILANAIFCKVPIIGVGLGVNSQTVKSDIAKAHFKEFSKILVRSHGSQRNLASIGIDSIVCGCPSFYDDIDTDLMSVEPMVVITPRYYGSDDKQLELIPRILKTIGNPKSIVLPFAPMDWESHEIDTKITKALTSKNPEIINFEREVFDTRRLRGMYINATCVINTGRYHSSLFALQLDKPMYYSWKSEIGMSHTDPIEKNTELIEEFGGENYFWENGFGYIEWDKEKRNEYISKLDIIPDSIYEYIKNL